MITLFTIGYAGKTFEKFLSLLKSSNVKKVVDIRIHHNSQISGFAKSVNLRLFLKELGGISYELNLDFAPTEDLLKRYKGKMITWEQYEIEYLDLLEARDVARKTDIETLNDSCLLCAEPTPYYCHRRLLAEYLQKVCSDVQIIHLI